MANIEEIALFIAVGNLGVVIIGLGFAGWQAFLARRTLDKSLKIHQADHDWQRRIAAQDALRQYNASVALSSLQEHFGYIDKVDAVPLPRLQTAFDENKELKKELHQLLNYYESLARGISQGIYDEEVIKSGRRGAMTRALQAFQFYINNRRTENGAPRAWCELEGLVAKWLSEENNSKPRNQTHLSG